MSLVTLLSTLLVVAWPATAQIPDDPGRFLRLFNDVSPAFAESEATGQAYYLVIDPADAKTTLEDFKVANGFATASDVTNAVYRNDADLGFGRNMYVWTGPDGSIISFVENFGDDSFDFGAGDTILDAIDGPAEEVVGNAIGGSETPEGPKPGFLATVAMEYGPPPGDKNGQKYTRFYVYAADGSRLTRVDLDGGGEKYVPGLCNVCHGGNPRPLDSDGSYPAHGDTDAGFIPWDLDTFVYSTQSGYSQSDQETAFRTLSEFVLSTAPTDAVRELVEGWYTDDTPGDTSLPANNFNGGFIPVGWDSDQTQRDLYLDAFAPNCRACHVTRTSPVEQFREHADFVELAPRISDLVFDRGVMPLANRTYDRFWASTATDSAADLIALAVGRDAVLDQPGDSPIPYAGVEHFVPLGLPIPLNAGESLFADLPGISLGWLPGPPPIGSPPVELDTPDQIVASFTPTVEAVYRFFFQANVGGTENAEIVRVIATATGEPTESDQFSIFSRGAVPPVPDSEFFDPDVMNVLSSCFGCHDGSGPGPAFAPGGDTSPSAVHPNIVSRTNLSTPTSSLILLKPTTSSGTSHGGGHLFDTGSPPYNTLLAWIEDGAPPSEASGPPVVLNDVLDAVSSCLGCHNGGEPSPDAPNFQLQRLDESQEDAIYRSLSMRTNVQQPYHSLLLQKPQDPAVDHEGGATLLSTSDPEYVYLLNWIRQGAQRINRPINDDLANALTLPAEGGSVSQTNVDATKETSVDGSGLPVAEPAHVSPGGNSLWWQWSSLDSGELTIDTEGSDFDTTLAVYTGAGDVASLTKIAEDDDSGAGLTSRVVLAVDGSPISIAADGYGYGGADSGSVVLNWSFDFVDSDGDGIGDASEVGIHGTDPLLADTDGDGLSDGDEVNLHDTDPLEADSDGDGSSDGDEISYGSDPNDPSFSPRDVIFGTYDVLNSNSDSDTGSDSFVQLTTDGAGNWIAVWESRDDLGGTIGIDVDILVARSSDTGVSWSAPAILNTNATGDAGNDSAPQLTTDGSGTWIAVWASNDTLGNTIGLDRDILVARSTDAGVSWSAPEPLNSNATSDNTAFASDSRPQVTTDGAGNWIAVWQSTEALGGTIGTDTDILVARSIDAGVSWSAPTTLNSNAATDTGSDFNPQLTTDGVGNWIAVWGSNDSLGATIGTDYDILVARSIDAGVSWSGPAALNTNAATDTGSDFNPQLTTDGVGTWVAVWESNDSLGGPIGNDRDILVAHSNDVGASWSAPAPLNGNAGSDPGYDFFPQLTTDAGGNWVALWTANTSISDLNFFTLMARSDDAGVSWSPPVVFNSKEDLSSGVDQYPQLTTDGVGNWIAVWGSSDSLGATIGTDYDIFFKAGTGPDTDADGLSDGAEANTHGTDPLLADTDGDGLSDGDEINLHGTDPLVIDTDGDGFGDGDELAVNADPNNFNSTPQGLNFSDPETLNTNAASDIGDDSSPQVTTDGAGNWVAVWDSYDSLEGTVGSDEDDIFFALSSDAGANWSAPAALNSSAESDTAEDRQSQLTTDGAGNWIAVWESYDSDSDILFARSSDAGASWSPQLALNTNAAIDADQDSNPQLTTDGSGNWIAVWDSYDGSDSDILFARSSDVGVSWSAPATLNSNAASDFRPDSAPQLTTDGVGNWIAVWGSGDWLSNTIGFDIDILLARSTDDGVSWSPQAALNTNATGDSGSDGNVQLVTDSVGNWVAVWQSSDSLGNTIGTDNDILVARSSDAGVSWSAPAALDANAASDTGSDSEVQLSTDGVGNWVAAWISDDSLGNTIGTDSDILFARSSDAGASWSTPIVLNRNAASDMGEDYGIQLTTDEVGNWVAAWRSDDLLDSPLGFDSEIFVATATGPDADLDGLWDAAEVNFHGTNPLLADSDSDGLSDDAELNLHSTNPLLSDTDSDGLSDGAEINNHATNPLFPDTDGDGISDGDEVSAGSDPNDSNDPVAPSVPALPPLGLAVLAAMLVLTGNGWGRLRTARS